ncbi:MAG: PglZ domain-containing protein [Candidatus Helarchaeota archaeon]
MNDIHSQTINYQIINYITSFPLSRIIVLEDPYKLLTNIEIKIQDYDVIRFSNFYQLRKYLVNEKIKEFRHKKVCLIIDKIDSSIMDIVKRSSHIKILPHLILNYLDPSNNWNNQIDVIGSNFWLLKDKLIKYRNKFDDNLSIIFSSIIDKPKKFSGDMEDLLILIYFPNIFLNLSRIDKSKKLVSNILKSFEKNLSSFLFSLIKNIIKNNLRTQFSNLLFIILILFNSKKLNIQNIQIFRDFYSDFFEINDLLRDDLYYLERVGEIFKNNSLFNTFFEEDLKNFENLLKINDNWQLLLRFLPKIPENIDEPIYTEKIIQQVEAFYHSAGQFLQFNLKITIFCYLKILINHSFFDYKDIIKKSIDQLKNHYFSSDYEFEIKFLKDIYAFKKHFETIKSINLTNPYKFDANEWIEFYVNKVLKLDYLTEKLAEKINFINSKYAKDKLFLEFNIQKSLNILLNLKSKYSNLIYGLFSKAFTQFIYKNYPKWVQDKSKAPNHISNILNRKLIPNLEEFNKVFIVLFDCMRPDILNYLIELFKEDFDIDIQPAYCFSSIPTSSKYARKILFSGDFHLEEKQSEAYLLSKLLPLKYRNEILNNFQTNCEKSSNLKEILEKIDNSDKIYILIYNFSDEFSHFIGNKMELFREIVNDLYKNSIFPLINRIVQEDNAVVFLTSDHGSIITSDSDMSRILREQLNKIAYYSKEMHPRFMIIPRTFEIDNNLLKNICIKIDNPKDWGLPSKKFFKDSYELCSYLIATSKFNFFKPRSTRLEHGGISFYEMIIPFFTLLPIKKLSIRSPNLILIKNNFDKYNIKLIYKIWNPNEFAINNIIIEIRYERNYIIEKINEINPHEGKELKTLLNFHRNGEHMISFIIKFNYNNKKYKFESKKSIIINKKEKVKQPLKRYTDKVIDELMRQL